MESSEQVTLLVVFYVSPTNLAGIVISVIEPREFESLFSGKRVVGTMVFPNKNRAEINKMFNLTQTTTTH